MQSLLTWRRWAGSNTTFASRAIRMAAKGVLAACLLATPVKSEQPAAADSPPPRVHPVEPGTLQDLSCSIQVESQPGGGQPQAATLVPLGGGDAARSRNTAGPETDPQPGGDSLLQRRLQQIVSELEALARAADSDGQTQIAQAIRKSIDNLKACTPTVQPDPGTLSGYRGQVGQSFVFEVTGRTDGNVWGSGIYTDDSMLATAAVHAGVLKPGEKGLVRVTIQPGLSAYTSDTQNGVTTTSYGAWEGSYTVSPAHVPVQVREIREPSQGERFQDVPQPTLKEERLTQPGVTSPENSSPDQPGGYRLPPAPQTPQPSANREQDDSPPLRGSSAPRAF